MDARLHPLDHLSQLRASITSSALSKQRQRVLLLVTLVPKGRYTTVAVIKVCMNIHFQPTGRVHVLGALQKNVWEDVPVHRVVDFGEGLCLASGARAAVGDEVEALDCMRPSSNEFRTRAVTRLIERGEAPGVAFRRRVFKALNVACSIVVFGLADWFVPSTMLARPCLILDITLTVCKRFHAIPKFFLFQIEPCNPTADPCTIKPWSTGVATLLIG